MAGSSLIEWIAGDILYYARYASSPQDRAVETCVALLKARSELLGLGRAISHYPGDDSKIMQAQLLASDISVRRRMHDPERIRSWVLRHYPRSYKFLDLKYRVRKMTTNKNSTLTTHISDILGIVDLALVRRSDYEPKGGLEELEAILVKMKKEGIDSRKNFKQWKDDMRGLGLWNAILEMDVYIRCKARYKDRERDNTSNNAELYVEPHPRIDGGRADVRVGKCHIEVYAPQGRFPSATHRAVEYSVRELCSKIMDKKQVRGFGKHESMLVVKCDPYAFDSKHLREMLEREVQASRSLGGVLLVNRRDGYYNTFFARNCQADVPLPKGTVDDICSLLEEMG